MTQPSENIYLRPEERIYEVAVDKDQIDWKSFLYQLIYNEGLDPWDIDLSLLTKKYLEALKEIKRVDFSISGKFLTIAVFLLKTKAEVLVEKDLRGIDQKIASVSQNEESLEGFEVLEEFDLELDAQINKKQRREKYSLKYRNPLARKRKVNIFDLIKVLEKTFEQSNKRRANFLQRHPGGDKYSGPLYERKKKDLKQIIDELHGFIVGEFTRKNCHVNFSSLIDGAKHKLEVLDKFIPLLHLHNHNRVELKQSEHFSEIEIHPVSNDE